MPGPERTSPDGAMLGDLAPLTNICASAHARRLAGITRNCYYRGQMRGWAGDAPERSEWRARRREVGWGGWHGRGRREPSASTNANNLKPQPV
eukprot:2092585-Pyramimonas_sp.AAC.1